jgi:hypothetical protein
MGAASALRDKIGAENRLMDAIRFLEAFNWGILQRCQKFLEIYSLFDCKRALFGRFRWRQFRDDPLSRFRKGDGWYPANP